MTWPWLYQRELVAVGYDLRGIPEGQRKGKKGPLELRRNWRAPGDVNSAISTFIGKRVCRNPLPAACLQLRRPPTIPLQRGSRLKAALSLVS